MTSFKQGDPVVATTPDGHDVGGVYLYPSAPGHHIVQVYVWNGSCAIFPEHRLRPAGQPAPTSLPDAVRRMMHRITDEMNACLEAHGAEFRVEWGEP